MSARVEIIAELAQGFEGSPDQARQLLQAAAGAGADAAKFQLVFADELGVRGYQHYDLFKTLEMPDDAWHALATRASSLGIELQTDIFGPRSLALAVGLGLRTIKLHPTDVTNVGLLDAVASSPVPRVLLGAGGTHAAELDRAVARLSGKSVVVLLGFQAYPTADTDNHIGRLQVLADRWRQTHPHVVLGFADHAVPGSAMRYALAASAVGAGAGVIEKHLTLDRELKLEDYEAALNPDEFREFVTIVRACAGGIGTVSMADDFGMSAAESKYRATIRRHVVAARDLKEGARITASDVTLKRTAATDPITDLGVVYDRILSRSIAANTPIIMTDLK